MAGDAERPPGGQPEQAGQAEPAEPAIHRGLNGVWFDRSRISFIDGRAGTLLYRGYSIHDLATRATFEEVACLLLHGELPGPAALAAFTEEERVARALPPAVVEVVRQVAPAHPMDVLRTGVSALAAADPDRGDDGPQALARKGVRLMAQMPMLVAAHHRLRGGQQPLPPRPDLGYAAHFLYALTGAEPTERASRLLDRDFILHAEHGSNASAFAARVVAGTNADLHAAVTAAVAALSGPSHGGAAENVMAMAREIGAPEHAAAYVQRLRAARQPVMGFGHRVYRAEDPRARHLREEVRALSAEVGDPGWYAILEAVVEAMRPYARLGVHVNVDFYAGVIYHLLGIPQDLFVPIFAIGRVPGWVAQVAEQREHNILLRPLLHYVGEPERPYPPLEERPDSPGAPGSGPALGPASEPASGPASGPGAASAS